MDSTFNTFPVSSSNSELLRRPTKVARVHVCDSCGYSTSRKSDLAKHQRIHTGVKPYVCKVCNRAFTQSSHLKVHRRLHTGERPYVCNSCGNTFRTYGHLSRHLKSHTTPTCSTATPATPIPATTVHPVPTSSSSSSRKRTRKSSVKSSSKRAKLLSPKTEPVSFSQELPIEPVVSHETTIIVNSPPQSPYFSPEEINTEFIRLPSLNIDSLFLPHAAGIFHSHLPSFADSQENITLDAICPSSSPPHEDSVFSFIPFELCPFDAPENLIVV